MKTLVVGAGAMGRWLGRVLQSDAQQSVSISFVDTNEAAATETAAALDATAVTPETTERYDLVCIAVPIPAAVDAIEEYAQYATDAVIDVTGTMDAPLDAMRTAAPDCERASLHPLFAPANEPGNIPAVIEDSGSTIAVVLNALRARGNDVFETTADEHDRLMKTVQAQTHAAVLAFARSASEDIPDRYHTPISEELTALADQVTSGESSVYADIQYAFDGAEDVAVAAREIADADRVAFEELYDSISFGQGETQQTATREAQADDEQTDSEQTDSEQTDSEQLDTE